MESEQLVFKRDYAAHAAMFWSYTDGGSPDKLRPFGFTLRGTVERLTRRQGLSFYNYSKGLSIPWSYK